MNKCTIEVIDNIECVIPMCMSVVNSSDILDCTCNEEVASIGRQIEYLNNRINALGDGFQETTELKQQVKLLKRRLK